MEKGEYLRDRGRAAPANRIKRGLNGNDMITPHGTLRLLGITTILLISGIFRAPSTQAAENQLRYADQRIPIDHARVRSRQIDADAAPVADRPRSLVAQAAHGRVLDESPSAPLDGSLVQGEVRQVGFLDGRRRRRGSVCDCGDPACGAEPHCGFDVIYDDGPACGFEVGCGVGAALEMLGPRSCGVEGCFDCAEAACGVEEIYMEDPGCGIEAYGDCSCDACSESCDLERIPFFLPLLRVNWNRFQFFAGVQGYKGPLNFANTNAANSNIRSGSGSFGFQQGFNEGRSLKRWLGWDLAAQLGVRATQSNLSGSEFTEDTRHQVFVTYGFFRRVDYGLQYGVVMDYLNDDWYFQGDLLQLRTELSWKTRGCHVYGFHYMASLDSDTSSTLIQDGTGNVISSSIAFESTDQYRFFYRRLLNGSGTWDAFAGWTDNDDGLIGANMNLPLRRNLMLQTGTTFLIPREGDSSGGNREEGWNISLGLVYRPGGPKGCGRYCRPMFDVADNGTFLVDRR